MIVVDTGCIGAPAYSGDVTREQVFAAAGASLESLRQRRDRGAAVTQAAAGAAVLVRAAFDQGRVDGVLALGGSAGTTIGTSAMRTLPLGVPKLMVSTLGSGQVRQYVGDKDILMFNSVVDIAGINRISRSVLNNAAAAMAGMVLDRAPDSADDRLLVAATMFGVTTPCVQRARAILEEAGYEVLVFHATGNGGQAMESLIAEGIIAGVLDITTTELADELVGGILTAGPDRLTAARGVGYRKWCRWARPTWSTSARPTRCPNGFGIVSSTSTTPTNRSTRRRSATRPAQRGQRDRLSGPPSALCRPSS